MNKIYGHRNKILKLTKYLGLFGLLIVLLFSCEKWEETADVSHVSALPEFTILGGEFMSFTVVNSAEFEDPGAEAYENNRPLQVYWFGEVDLTTVGVYIVGYYAENSDGLSSIGERIVAVTNKSVSSNDLSGDYTGTLWGQTEMKVSKVDEKGLYKCTEVFGYPLSEMKGRFVDLGNNELVLLHGEGDFGRYSGSDGEYTRSTLSWTIFLEDEPYSNVSIPVLWTKVKEEN